MFGLASAPSVSAALELGLLFDDAVLSRAGTLVSSLPHHWAGSRVRPESRDTGRDAPGSGPRRRRVVSRDTGLEPPEGLIQVLPAIHGLFWLEPMHGSFGLGIQLTYLVQIRTHLAHMGISFKGITRQRYY